MKNLNNQSSSKLNNIKVLIIGASGFIGSNLCEAILAKTHWKVFAIDIVHDKIADFLSHKNFNFISGDMTVKKKWLTEHIKECDVILPLAAIALPSLYVKDPLHVFELDFKANLDIIYQCVKFKKRLIFPSTSEVYGMCLDPAFDEEKSNLVTGPINKERWIYSSAKQLLDRVIYAYGKHQDLSYTIFRPFNWYGPREDDVYNSTSGSSRVLSQFIGNIMRGENIMLVNGGKQHRCFTYIDDGISALMKIIKNENNCAHNHIFNIGNPDANISIRKLAEILLELFKEYNNYSAEIKKVKLINIDENEYYGEGYQDMISRVPVIHNAEKLLNWTPKIDIKTGIKKTLDFYLNRVI